MAAVTTAAVFRRGAGDWRRLSRCLRRRGLATAAAASSSSHHSVPTSVNPPATSLSLLWNPTEEHRALRDALRNFVVREVEPQADHYNKTETFNIDLFRRLGSDHLGLLGLTVDPEWGGAGLDAAAVALVHEELSYADPAFGLSYLAHSLLLTHNLSMNGSEPQKRRFLPDLCAGTRIGGMGMSEPGAGTDVLGSLQTRASRDSSAAADAPWVLNGTKMWITNGTLDGVTTGDLFLVYARTGPGRTDVTQFLIEKDMPGFRLGQQIKDKLGMRASPTAELVLEDVLVPAANVVGQVHGATLCMMRNLEVERLGLAAMALGIARRCLDAMKQYAGERRAFGRDLYAFGQVQRHIAESYAAYMAGRAYVYGVAGGLDLATHGNGLDADGTKLYSAQMAKEVADRAIQVLGGNGYVGEYKVERFWRDAKLLEIGGGTNESHHKNMCRDLRRMGATPLE